MKTVSGFIGVMCFVPNSHTHWLWLTYGYARISIIYGWDYLCLDLLYYGCCWALRFFLMMMEVDFKIKMTNQTQKNQYNLIWKRMAI
mgnify:CR=1 FL=1